MKGAGSEKPAKRAKPIDTGGPPCGEAQSDGVPCEELGSDCEDCEQADPEARKVYKARASGAGSDAYPGGAKSSRAFVPAMW